MGPFEARTFVESTRSDRLGTLYLLAIATGMRQGEILGLSWAELDVDGGEIRVVATLSHASRAAQLKAPKTEGSRRRIAIPPSVLPALRAHRIRQLEERLLAGSRCRSRVWCSRRPSEHHWTARRSPGGYTGYSALLVSHRSPFTTCGTAVPRSCSLTACPSASSWRSSATATSG